MFPKNSNTYIAYNVSRLIGSELKDIEIVNVFSPFIPENKLMAYTVESMDSNNQIAVKFYNPDTDFILLNTWSVGKKNLYIQCSIDMTNVINYSTSALSID
jgi:hypothetical protein